MFRLIASLLVAGSAGLSLSCGAVSFADPLDTPARLSPKAVTSAVYGLGLRDINRVVGVGPRGHVLLSDDAGASWRQAPSPLSTDLLAVSFATPDIGWAVGHDGVVMKSIDGGQHWARVLDGRSLAGLLVGHYDKLAAAGGSADIQRARGDAARLAEEGPTKPFLGVWFRNAREGWVVGQFNLILHTADGGASWQPWLDRTENPDGYSLHAVQGAGDEVYVVGELGLVLQLQQDRFKRITTPYAGSWFGLAVKPGCLVTFGLRGSAWRSTDAGASWQQLETGVTTALNAGAFLPDGRLVLATQRGQLLVGEATGSRLTLQPPRGGLDSAYALVPIGGDRVLVSGARGVQRVALGAR
jgi:photosystem II stability/assembly factor-like uncharacterized protein